MIEPLQFVSCSNCFKNIGIVFEARRIGQPSPDECPRCGARDGAKLGKDDVSELQDIFFVGGGRATAYYPSPIGIAGASLSAAEFEANTWSDYQLMKSLSGRELFWYGPPLYRLGYSMLREKIQARLKPGEYEWPLSVGQDTPIEELWDEVISILRPTTLNEGDKLYRARLLAKNPLDPSEYDAPPPDRIKPNRFNDSTYQVFYGGLDVETCMLELKLGPAEIVRNEVTVARFALKQGRSLLNLCETFPQGLEHADFLERIATLDGLLFPHDQDYFMTQSLSRHVAKRGFDGILHPSAFRYLGNPEARNMVLFGSPLKETVLQLLDINSVSVRTLNYDLQFGPAYEQL